MPQAKTKAQQKRDAARRQREIARTGVKVVVGAKKKATGVTAADVAKYAPGRGGLAALAKKTKAGRKADAHVQAYRRHKKKPY